MVDFSKSNKMMKISGKVNKSNTTYFYHMINENQSKSI